jgi:hypothetical protein
MNQLRDSRMNQIKDLLQTMIDGANYAHHQINHGDLSMAVIVTEDIIAGFVSIEETVVSMKDELNDHDAIEAHLALVKETLNKIVLSFESTSYQQISSIIKRSLVKQLTDLRIAIEQIIDN